jgi:hypothetical protein
VTDSDGPIDFDLGDGVLPFSLDPALELGEFVGTYAAAKDDPERLVAEMQENPDFRIAMARADVRHHLLRWFQESDAGWQEDPRRSGSLGEEAVATPWSFSGIPAEKGTVGGELASNDLVTVVGFNGLVATGREITVRGLTVMTVERDEETEAPKLSVHRHVDWAGLYGQLGLTLNWRIPTEGSDPDS